MIRNILWLFCFGYLAVAGYFPAPPDGRKVLSGDEQLRLVLSKISPLEMWSSSSSNSGTKICWKLYRPHPQMSEDLANIILNFKGNARWIFRTGDCLESNTNDSSVDLAHLARVIEETFHLKNILPQPFSEFLLTREGLARTPGAFQDFAEGGDRTVYLIASPGTNEIFEPSEKDKLLHFAPFSDELNAILGEIVGQDLAAYHDRVLTESERKQIQTHFPIIWEISDYYEDSYLSPDQAKLLYQECLLVAARAKSPKALRGLDKLMRIGHWASARGYGILFSAP